MNGLLPRIVHGIINRSRRTIAGYRCGYVFMKGNHNRSTSFDLLRGRTLSFIDSMRLQRELVGRYGYSYSQKYPLLYNSIFAALTRHLFGDLNTLSKSKKEEWCDYINTYQCDDGLFRDPLIDNAIAETCDWWGWRHMTLHVTMGLSALGGVAAKPFKLLAPYLEPDYLITWMESRNWKEEPANVSNEVQNIGTLLQYARDFHNDVKAGEAVIILLDWLDKHQDPENGTWGRFPGTKVGLSLSVQTGYHLWCIYFYDQRPINYVERIIDCALTTQNKYGGFGVPANSSACEDIDSIDPLVRLSFLTNYRHGDIAAALEKALNWVLFNMNEDGSFALQEDGTLDMWSR